MGQDIAYTCIMHGCITGKVKNHQVAVERLRQMIAGDGYGSVVETKRDDQYNITNFVIYLPNEDCTEDYKTLIRTMYVFKEISDFAWDLDSYDEDDVKEHDDVDYLKEDQFEILVEEVSNAIVKDGGQAETPAELWSVYVPNKTVKEFLDEANFTDDESGVEVHVKKLATIFCGRRGLPPGLAESLQAHINEQVVA